MRRGRGELKIFKHIISEDEVRYVQLKGKPVIREKKKISLQICIIQGNNLLR